MKKNVIFETNLSTSLVTNDQKELNESLEITKENLRKSIIKPKLSVYPQIDFKRESLFVQKKDYRKIYLNQSIKNQKKFKYRDNFIKTSRYNCINFLPLSLFHQFKRNANIYFLVIAISQCFPIFSSMHPATALAPLIVVLLVSMAREGIEDYYKHLNDEKENMETVMQYKGGEYKKELSKNLQVGDIIKIEEYNIFPADILILSCSNLNKMAYIETANLDGEKNLKPKFCIGSTFNIFKDANNIVRIRGKILCDKPNSDLNVFNGRIKLTSSIDIAVSIKQLLLKGMNFLLLRNYS